MWNLKYDPNEFIYKTEIDSQTHTNTHKTSKLMLTKEDSSWVGGDKLGV